MSGPVCVLAHRTDPDRPRRAADRIWCCLGCLARVEAQLAELPRLYDDLIFAHLGRVRAGQRVSGTHSPPIPYSDAAGDDRDLIVARLASWCADFAGRWGMAGPADVDPVVTAGWLRTHLEKILADAGTIRDFAAEIDGTWAAARRHAYPNPGAVVPLVPCPLCGRKVTGWVRHYDSLLPVEVVCKRCELAWPIGDWERLREGQLPRVMPA